MFYNLFIYIFVEHLKKIDMRNVKVKFAIKAIVECPNCKIDINIEPYDAALVYNIFKAELDGTAKKDYKIICPECCLRFLVDYEPNILL